jgi:lysine 2,3-aminomutase
VPLAEVAARLAPDAGATDPAAAAQTLPADVEAKNSAAGGEPLAGAGGRSEALPRPGLEAGRLAAARRFPVRWTRYYLELTDAADPRDPVRRIAFPDPAELDADALDLADPVGERRVNPVPFVVRKHDDRAVLLVTARCHVYCRFCFRRSFPDGDHRDPSASQLDHALEYLTTDERLREVILSGGDPLVLPDAELERIIGRLSGTSSLECLRVHTRAPVHDPDRVTPALAAVLASGLPCRVVTHFNHPREITDATRRAVACLRAAGLPVLNQSVLLAGVNDDPTILAALCRGLVNEGVEPYYLHHPDRVPGAASFYVGLERGLQIHDALRENLGAAHPSPVYVIDLPDGSGKVPVASLDPEERERIETPAPVPVAGGTAR